MVRQRLRRHEEWLGRWPRRLQRIELMGILLRIVLVRLAQIKEQRLSQNERVEALRIFVSADRSGVVTGGRTLIQSHFSIIIVN